MRESGRRSARESPFVGRYDMLRGILVCAALLTPGTVFADGQSPAVPGGAEEDRCPEKDYKHCFQSPRCYWDIADVRCEWIAGGRQCPTRPDPDSCKADPACFWDPSDAICERLIYP